ncbi:MAG: NusG domain II-containing protein [Clostridiales bacterium]|jgi:hypothetical protein|nr:NusG domain II-containing protein [Clostridiales bacterium]
MASNRVLFGKRDIWVFAGLIIAALLTSGILMFAGSRVKNAEGVIYVNQSLVKKVDLSKNGEFTLDENPRVKFSVKDGAVAFIESDCPDKVCVHSGYLKIPGQAAVCLPNRVSLRIEGTGEAGELDAVAN